MNEVLNLAAKLNATVHTDSEGRIGSVEWNGSVYGGSSLTSLQHFAEKARAALGGAR